eukprot:COSAG02_NODE_3124_length_7320_cov_12.366154_2_plen_256_part_00
MAALDEARKAKEARLAKIGGAPPKPKRPPPQRPKAFVPGTVLTSAQHKKHLTTHLANCELQSGTLKTHLAEHAEKLFDGVELNPATSATPQPEPVSVSAGDAPPARSSDPRPQSAPASPGDAMEAARRAKLERQQRARAAAAAGKLETSPKPASPAAAAAPASKPSLTPRRTVSEEDRAAARKLRDAKRSSARNLNSSPLPSTPEAGGRPMTPGSPSADSPSRRTVSEAERAAARKAREEKHQKARERAATKLAQ